MKDKIEAIVFDTCKKLYGLDVKVDLTRPDPQFGDYATYVAFELAGPLHKTPKEVAKEITDELGGELIGKAEVAGPGFVNIYLSNDALAEAYLKPTAFSRNNKDEQEIIEFSDPNPFKEMHLGHLYQSVLGDTLARLRQAGGADVKRISYHGDIGMHVAKCIWGMGEAMSWDVKKLDGVLSAHPLGFYYAKGAKAFAEDKQIKAAIQGINESIYKQDRDDVNAIYKAGTELSFKQFDQIFDRIGVKFDKRYLESLDIEIGLEMVKKNIGKVFKKSDGAIVYEGEKVGLHTRVFINSRGLPTYETKDLGLAQSKESDFPKATLYLVLTGSEQAEYFKVMLAALAEINPSLAKKTRNINNGLLSLSTGKMSSRTGDVYTAEKLLDDVETAIAKQYPDSKVKEDVFMASIRYTFLSQRVGSSIVFDTQQSVSLEGNSGPYIQYAHARGLSIMEKASTMDEKLEKSLKVASIPLEKSERLLASKISEFSEVVERSVEELMPHHICNYLYELAQEFNRFYEKNRVIDDPRMFTRLVLVKSYTEVLKSGLNLLGIPTPMHM